MNQNLTVVPIAHLMASIGYNGKNEEDIIEIENAEQLKTNMLAQYYMQKYTDLPGLPEVDFSQRKVLVVRDYDYREKYDVLALSGFTLEGQTLNIKCRLAARNNDSSITVGMSLNYNVVYLSVPRGLTYKVDKVKSDYNYHIRTAETDELSMKKHELKKRHEDYKRALETFRRLESKALNESVVNQEMAQVQQQYCDVQRKIVLIINKIITDIAGPYLRDLCEPKT